MGEIALPAPTRHVPWRAVALLTAALLIVAASLVVVGSRRPALPPPFGPAANGVIVYGTADGDIAAYDPVSDVTTTLVGGAAVEQYPIISNDGTRLSFARTPTGGGAEADFTASMDGSDIRDFLPSGPTISWWDESASGDRVILSRVVDGVTTLSIVDFATGRETPIAVDLALGIKIAMHRPGHDEIVYEHVPADGQPGTTVYVGPGDGAGPLRPVAISPDAANEAWPSPDGSKLVYTTWGTDEAQHGRIRVVDMDSGTDTPLHFEGSEGTIELAPQFSPDGKRLALRRFRTDGGVQVVIVPADGIGATVETGPIRDRGGDIQWSPDGEGLVASYDDDGSVWLLSAAGGPGRRLDGVAWDRGVTWQRLAP